MSQQLCATRPADWWEPRDDGARLAIALCRACPALTQCPDGDPHPAGVIRAAVAYADTGAALPECPTCGYPQLNARCRRCRVPATPIRSLGAQARRAYWRHRARAARQRRRVQEAA